MGPMKTPKGGKQLIFPTWGLKRALSFPPVVFRQAVIIGILMAHTAWSANDAVVWERAQLLDAEQVAKSGRVDVPMPIVKLAIPVNFSNFRYPFLQADKSVVFIANDGEGDGREGIYRIAANGELSILAGEYDEFDNAPFVITDFSGLRVAGGRAVFRCSFANGAGDGGVGIGMWEDGVITLLARTGDALGLEDIGYPGLSAEIVTFLAHRNGEVGELYAVDLATFPRLPRKVADTATAIPGQPGKFFGSFGFQQDADGAHAIFRGFDVGARELLQRTGDGAAALGGVYRKNIRSSDSPEKIVDTRTELPGARSGTTFAELQNALPRDGTVVVPTWSRDHSGIYFIDRNGETHVVADTATRIPDLFDGPFIGFDKWAANCAPYVIFRGYARGYEGLFAMNMDRNELYLLLDRREMFDGKVIAGLEFGSNARIDEDLVLAVEFTDGSSGVYLLKFGDGWGKAIFRRENSTEGSASSSPRGAAAGTMASEETKSAVEPSVVAAPAVAPTTIEFLEEGSFRMSGDSQDYDAPEAATGKRNEVDEAELLQAGSVFPANKGLNFGYRYVLHAPGDERCGVDGFDMFIVHPPIKGPDGRSRTTSTIPMKVCFNDGKAEDFLIYSLEQDYEVLPGSWILQVRKDGEVLISRSYTLL